MTGRVQGADHRRGCFGPVCWAGVLGRFFGPMFWPLWSPSEARRPRAERRALRWRLRHTPLFPLSFRALTRLERLRAFSARAGVVDTAFRRRLERLSSRPALSFVSLQSPEQNRSRFQLPASRPCQSAAGHGSWPTHAVFPPSGAHSFTGPNGPCQSHPSLATTPPRR